jgi:excisionase family DNA binding protein
MKTSELVTADQAAQIIGVTDAHIRWLIRHSHLPATKLGWSWLIRRADAERYRRRPVGRPRKAS